MSSKSIRFHLQMIEWNSHWSIQSGWNDERKTEISCNYGGGVLNKNMTLNIFDF